jgi:hypothetical protein
MTALAGSLVMEMDSFYNMELFHTRRGAGVDEEPDHHKEGAD